MTGFALLIDGARYSGWKKLSVTRSLREASSAFVLSVSERWLGQETAWPIRPGQRCALELDGETVVTGHVDLYDAGFTETQHTTRVEGRSKTADLVDCAAVVKGGQFKNYDAGAVARALAGPFGVDIQTVGSLGAAFADVQVQQGETCFALIERLARMRGLLVTDAASGALMIGRLESFDTRPAAPLRQGKEVRSASVRLDWSQRFSTYTVKAQHAGSDELFGETAAQIVAQAPDPDVKRHRPWLEVAESSSDQAAAQKRANWQASTSAGRATEVSLTVRGWRAEDGSLWSPGRRAAVELPALGVSRELVVERVAFDTGSDTGTTTRLTLVPSTALQPEPLAEKTTTDEDSII